MTLCGEFPLPLSGSERVEPWAFLLEPYLIFSPIWLLPSGVAASHLRRGPAHQLTPHCLSLFRYIHSSLVILQASCIASANHRNHLNLVSCSLLSRCSRVAEIKLLSLSVSQRYNVDALTARLCSSLPFQCAYHTWHCSPAVPSWLHLPCAALCIDLDSWPSMF